MSNRERIARARAEAEAAAAERARKKSSAASAADGAKPARKRVAKPTRMKIVWEICSGSGEVVRTYAYSERAAAEAELHRLSSAKREHVLRTTKVPMD